MRGSKESRWEVGSLEWWVEVGNPRVTESYQKFQAFVEVENFEQAIEEAVHMVEDLWMSPEGVFRAIFPRVEESAQEMRRKGMLTMLGLAYHEGTAGARSNRHL